MIVAGAEGFVKGQYRKFNIKSADLAPGDDYAMMREVLTRRFKRIADAEVLDDIENEVANSRPRPRGLRPAPAAGCRDRRPIGRRPTYFPTGPIWC